MARYSGRRVSAGRFLLVQAVFCAAFATAWLLLPAESRRLALARATHTMAAADVHIAADTTAAVITPLYDDPTVVDDQELADVLRRILPRFSRQHLRPNYVEHAMRTWGSTIEFTNPDIISGPQMRDFLTDAALYADSWGDAADPILEPTDGGVAIRWGGDRSASVHHDHLLACMTEAGVPLDAPVYAQARSLQFGDILSQSLRDFRPDERETEWSVMSYALWLAPQQIRHWHNGQGREISMDLLAERLMRSQKQQGVCLGTHRVYSLMALLRLDEQSGGVLVKPSTRSRIMQYLADVRDLIIAAQDPDGSWPPNWTDGAEAAAKADPDARASQRVIATGHHLEWLAIAPEELHPPRDAVRRAADWAIRNTQATPQAEIDQNFTFYSHVGNALALWRQTHPADFWVTWRETHPDSEQFDVPPAGEVATDAAHP